MGKSFETKKRDRTVVEFDVDGDSYTFTAPKRSGLIASVVSTVGLDETSTANDSVRDLMNWVGDGLPEDQRMRLFERLTDPDDDFDLDQVNEIARYLLGQTSNRPTRRRSGS